MKFSNHHASVAVAVVVFALSSCDSRDGSSGENTPARQSSPRAPSPSAPPLAKSLEGRVVFASDRDGDFELYVMHLPSRRIRQLTYNHVDDDSPDWSPDGRSVVFTRERPPRETRGGLAATAIMKMRRDGSGQRVLTPRAGLYDDAEWSPDGDRIVFTRGELSRDGSTIGIMKHNGKKLRSVVFEGSSATFAEPSWSPSGRELVFIYWVDDIGRAEARCCNRGRRVVFDDLPGPLQPSWSPDGDRLLFGGTYRRCRDPAVESTCRYQDEMDLFIAESFEPDPIVRRLKEPFHSPAGDWSPSGEEIIFYSRRRGSFDIFVTNADGSDLRRLTDHPSDEIHPDWFVTR